MSAQSGEAKQSQIQAIEVMLDRKFTEFYSNIDDKLSNINKTIDKRIGKLNSRLNAVDKQIDELERRLGDLNYRSEISKTFPEQPSVPPSCPQSVARGSVSKPKWSKRSIFG